MHNFLWAMLGILQILLYKTYKLMCHSSQKIGKMLKVLQVLLCNAYKLEDFNYFINECLKCVLAIGDTSVLRSM